jgi:hypothetical protein
MMSEEWGKWIAHDGAAPLGLKDGDVLKLFYDGPVTGEATISSCDPGWFWRWKAVKTGWFSSEKRRVCDDPTAVPIKAYRIRKPRGLVMLERLIADLPAPPPKVREVLE